mmetsp:Transcript_7805/g.15580  ORF Transcript_7805/g.15580 Transcript_7805/m.15580 type:complete len:256 (-) Transcript_7805:156-923(-)
MLSSVPSFNFLPSQTLQNAANPLPKQECTVALNAPGKYDNGSAPMLFANTTAKALFCIPVSIEMVRAVRSVKPKNFFGTRYPKANPRVCVSSTESKMSFGTDMAMAPERNPDVDAIAPPPPKNIPALFATTPPQIKLTKTTLAKGVHLETHLQNLGIFSFNTTPKATGPKTTFVVATHNALPLTGMALPTIVLVKRGVTAEAKMVLHAVKRTLSATSARAMRLTRLEAVPPGLHPTSISPRNKSFPMGWEVSGSR